MNDNKSIEDQVIDKVEAIGAVAAAMMEVMRKEGIANDNLTWFDMVTASALACRGVAAMAMTADKDLTLDKACSRMTQRFVEVMSLPPELVRTVKAPDGEDAQVVVVPVKRH